MGQDMVAIAFYSITGQTQRFIDKSGLTAHRIDDASPKFAMGEEYVLIVPSYQDFMMDSIVEFLNYKDNKKKLVGIIGCGNRNFNDLFAQTAKKIAATLKVPILYLMEFSGTLRDVDNVRRIMKRLNGGTNAKGVAKPKEMRGKISFLSDYK